MGTVVGSSSLGVTVEAITVSRALSPDTDVGKVFTNEGATGMITLSLPPAEAGLNYKAIVTDADGITFDADAGDTIRVNTELSAASGTAASTQIGATLELVCVNATEWIALAGIGTWTVT